jgi:hypothetical protein
MFLAHSFSLLVINRKHAKNPKKSAKIPLIYLKLASANIFHSTCKFTNHSYCLNNYHPMKKKGSRTRYTRAGIWREMKVEIFTILFPSRERGRGGPQQLASILRNPTPSCTIWRQPLRHPIPSPLSFSFRNIHFFLAAEGYHNSSIHNHTGGRTWLRCAMAATAAEIKLLITVTIRPRGGGEERRRDSPFFFVPAVPSCVISIDPRYPGTVSTESSIVY